MPWGQFTDSAYPAAVGDPVFRTGLYILDLVGGRSFALLLSLKIVGAWLCRVAGYF